MITINRLVELNYVFFSLLLVIYGVWRYYKQRKKNMLYFALCFTFLALSAIFQMLSSTLVYLGIYFNVTMLRLLELSSLTLFACFTICAIIALKKT
jgi:hypothetical protein